MATARVFMHAVWRYVCSTKKVERKIEALLFSRPRRFQQRHVSARRTPKRDGGINSLSSLAASCPTLRRQGVSAYVVNGGHQPETTPKIQNTKYNKNTPKIQGMTRGIYQRYHSTVRTSAEAESHTSSDLAPME